MSGDSQVLVERFALPAGLVAGSFVAFLLAAVTWVELFTLAGVCLLVGGVVTAVRVAQDQAAAPVVVSTVPVPDPVRQQRLQEYVSTELARSRGRIESVTPYTAVVVTGQRVNHVLHLLVSVLLCGLWLPVWLVIALTGGEKRFVLAVDQCGNVTRV
ncbi:hypothetical protein SEA_DEMSCULPINBOYZ_114 [Mycobacterium phage Demsculpinboyz]|uniref:Uncharacterized protein n=1 Tax=Mycobacterium phage Demsculpinboyz TaxID=2041528 RepID=A0A2D1GA76_9CAUD|nr:hypothetical protein I5I02_gp114 [Mycobacterium phage Demsculpinboyz]ATN88709.1 hypothetical protein SEA_DEMSCULPINBOYZ_114 [Mycobacterium phage Demsculpinboyz]